MDSPGMGICIFLKSILVPQYQNGEVCLKALGANWAPIFILFCLRFQFFDIVGPVGYILGILSLVMILNFPAFL
jgi:hypothetical protein